MLKAIRKRVRIPVVALGGVNLRNARTLVHAGADSVCAISAVVTKKDVFKEILKFQAIFYPKVES